MASSKKISEQLILMGDVINSSNKDQPKLANELSELVASINQKYETETLSPYTITLGDEFQGVTQSISAGIHTILDFEEECIKRELNFKLHYVFLKGFIETEINPEIAYGMMGEGLTKARNILTEKKRGRKRFRLELGQETLNNLEDLFEVMDGITSQWKLTDYPLIYDMIQSQSDAEVGEKHQKDRSLIWRRRKTLMIKEYTLLKSFIKKYVGSNA